jgi:hypothetical protein
MSLPDSQHFGSLLESCLRSLLGLSLDLSSELMANRVMVEKTVGKSIAVEQVTLAG